MPCKKSRKAQGICQAVIISDTHAGCKMALCSEEASLDGGGTYKISAMQRKILNMWEEFWNVWVPQVTQGEPYCVIHNGDAIDGVHHNSTTQISHNLEDQADIAYNLLKPIVEKCEGRYYHIRGTEAHVGQSGVDEEKLAKRLGAIKNKEGQHARYDLWKKLGGSLIHCLHHIGSTGSAAYEATAVHKELVESYVEAGRWDKRPPDAIVRSHRHRNIEIKIPTDKVTGIAIVTPCWQAKTPFAYKIPGARLSTPQFGGILLREGELGFLYALSKVWTIERSEEE